MRTTVNIDDDLYRQVKETAARTGRTVAAVLEDAVRRGLHIPDPEGKRPFSIRPMGRGGLRPGIDLSSNAALAEAMSEDGTADALR